MVEGFAWPGARGEWLGCCSSLGLELVLVTLAASISGEGLAGWL